MKSDYGLWFLVVLNSALILGFAFSFVKPKTFRDWRSFGAFSAFIVALFAEMYGFPLTIYLLSGWLVEKVPGLDLLAHNSGHLLEDLFGWGGDPHMGPFHIASYILILCGFWLLSGAWKVLYHAQREHILATAGPYARVRHPQYIAFILIMAGFLLQWPTIPTLVMFPILVFMYVRLAKKEDKDAQREFGTEWDTYAAKTPAFLPGIMKRN
jgi:protein-S-isoprenylcysteine O-methyltransferase Ste14